MSFRNNITFAVAFLTLVVGSSGSVGAATVTLGDFNNDAIVDAMDFDLLREAITSGNADPTYDLNQDALVDLRDFSFEVETLRGTAFGDADLDQQVDAGDLALTRANFGKSGGWGSANFNLDSNIDAPDLALVRASFGYSGSEWVPQLASAPLPLAASSGLFLLGSLGISRWVLARRR